MSTDPAHRAEVRVITDLDGLLGLRPHWLELFDASAMRSATLRFEWLVQWWRVYGPTYGAGGLNVITVWQAGRLAGALPLYRRVSGRVLRHARLQFISTGEAEFEETCPEYLDLLVRPGLETLVLGAVRAALLGGAMARWDDLHLLDLAEQSSPLLAQAGGMGLGFGSVEVASRGVCLAADLEGGFEAYLGRLSPNSRQQARRALRAADRAGACLDLVTDSGEIDAAFDDLVRLHQGRWESMGQPGCFSAPRFTEFHRGLARELVPQSAAVLARLRVGDEALAVIYGFVTAGKFDFYQSGVRLDGHDGLARPGIVAHLWLMSRLAERGVTCYDFLRGTADYKRRLSTSQRPMARLRVVRPTLRSACWAVALLFRRNAGRALRAAMRLLGGPTGASSLGAIHQLCAEFPGSVVLALGAVV